ncbi:pilus assembly protein [Marinobacter nauticus]|jgi:type IV pilus assembly protein PilY1|uniref:Type IV fimbrial biogenesis protein PilY1 n=1 Tax=Marinobacter nauticus TaxID=2743 RepID=A0A833JLV5_MARNT|nr:PilC/PilY family type IV pilus protein [Marinobacter nauticus]KAE8544244.1 Type IV fimbrial biogenesis protein PilY1 [Marinobacter nauticus]
MKNILRKIAHAGAGFGLIVPALTFANVPFSDIPLFISGSAKPNVIYAVDDSGSMDFEVVSPLYSGSKQYLFNAGKVDSSKGDGGWLTNTGGDGQIPFTRKYYFLRSSDYNAVYYNPDSSYEPWPDSDAYTFADSTPSAAKYEPTSSDSKTLNLTTNTTDSNGNSFYPATYFEVVEDDLTVNNTYFNVSYSCKNPPELKVYSKNNYQATLFQDWEGYPDDTTLPAGVDGLGPDLRCLKKVELTSGDELQNFANWFTYYRRIHHATRGGIGESLEGLAGIRVGTFWIHNLRDVSMEDLDTERGDFLDDTYDRFGKNYSGGGTPLRAALLHAGKQFDENANIIEAECQKNFTLLFTDGFNNSYITGVGNTDGDNGSPYADKASNTLADVAMKYYETRLRSGAYPAGKVRLPEGCYKQEGDPGFSSLVQKRVETTDPSYDASVDCNVNLHMNTYTIGFGAIGERFVGNGYDSVSDVYVNPPNWDLLGDVDDSDEDQVDDLLHAAVNGRGEFYGAANADELRKSLQRAIRDIVRSTGSATNVTFNTATLEQGSEVYTASFNSGDWSGSVAARALNPVTGAIGSTVWDAADTLNSMSPTNRFIVTYNSGGVPFAWNQLSVDQQDDLNGPANDGLGPDRLAYLRGDRSKENMEFRKRSTVLGDVVNSSPVYVGAPASGLPDRDPFGAASTGRYSTFKQDKANRTPVVYAGANDGMLHGFNAKTGQEVMAYIPSFVYSTSAGSGLNYLSDPGYQHRFYVDLSPAVADVYIGDANGTGAAWKTALIGGLRSGGRGLFALDVTDPSQFDGTATAADSLVLWEFSHPDLGYITEPPLIALVQWGNNDYRWSALVPNGYNSDNGKTGLFVLDIEAGQDGWDASDYKFIELQQSGSGLSPLRAVDYKDTSGVAVRDGIVDRIYAGDLNGNVWAVDLSGGSFRSVYASGNGNNAPAEPFFVAKDASGNPQPITTAPVMGRNIYNTQGSSPNLFVFFGTGRYLTTSDPNSTATQSFYGVWDQGSKVTRAQLASRSITESTKSGREVRTVGGSGIDWTDPSANAKRGWYVDFTPEPGERVIESPLVRGEYVLFNTVTPSQSLCQSGGTSWTMALRFDGTTPEQPVFDVNNDGKVDSNDAIVGGVRYGDAMILNSNILGDNLYRQASDGKVDQTKVDLGGGKTLGRSGWREIYEE